MILSTLPRSSFLFQQDHPLRRAFGIPFAFREKRTSTEWNLRAAASKAREDANATRLARGVAEIAHPLSTAADLDEAVSMLRLLREHAAACREDGPETLFNAEHHHTGIPDFLLSFAERGMHPVMDDLREPRGHRAIGVVYHPELEQDGNHVPSILPGRYDAFILLDGTRAVAPLHMPERVDEALPEAY